MGSEKAGGSRPSKGNEGSSLNRGVSDSVSRECSGFCTESRLLGNERADTSRPSSMRGQVLDHSMGTQPTRKAPGNR